MREVRLVLYWLRANKKFGFWNKLFPLKTPDSIRLLVKLVEDPASSNGCDYIFQSQKTSNPSLALGSSKISLLILRYPGVRQDYLIASATLTKSLGESDFRPVKLKCALMESCWCGHWNSHLDLCSCFCIAHQGQWVWAHRSMASLASSKHCQLLSRHGTELFSLWQSQSSSHLHCHKETLLTIEKWPFSLSFPFPEPHFIINNYIVIV